MSTQEQDVVLEEICSYVKEYEIKEMLQEYLKRWVINFTI